MPHSQGGWIFLWKFNWWGLAQISRGRNQNLTNLTALHPSLIVLNALPSSCIIFKQVIGEGGYRFGTKVFGLYMIFVASWVAFWEEWVNVEKEIITIDKTNTRLRDFQLFFNISYNFAFVSHLSRAPSSQGRSHNWRQSIGSTFVSSPQSVDTEGISAEGVLSTFLLISPLCAKQLPPDFTFLQFPFDSGMLLIRYLRNGEWYGIVPSDFNVIVLSAPLQHNLLGWKLWLS